MVRNWQKTNNTGTWGGDWNVYTYDALNRLVREKEMDTGLTITYGYDSLGNKILEQDSRDHIRYTYNELNQLVEKEAYNRTTNYAYDRRGNRVLETSVHTQENRRTYEWDETNRLVKGTRGPDYGLYTSEYTYNGLGQRVNSTIMGPDKTVYDRDYTIDYTSPEHNDIAEYNVGRYQWQGEKKVHDLNYLYSADGRRLQVEATRYNQWSPEAVSYKLNVHEDILGSSTWYTRQENGYNANHHDYTTWGNNTKAPSYNYDPEYRATEPYFTGHPYDGSLNLYYAENRFYDPETGSWLSSDPARDGLNWYEYCGSNPVTCVDPLGLATTIKEDNPFFYQKLQSSGINGRLDLDQLPYLNEIVYEDIINYINKGREIYLPEVVTGIVNGNSVSLNPLEDWGAIGYGKYPSGIQKDVEGRYLIAVGPKILNPFYADNGKIWGSEFDGLSKRVDVIVRDKATGNLKTIECVVNDYKAHTYNDYPAGQPFQTGDTASLDIESGLIQTGIAYPNSVNAKKNKAFSESNMHGSSIEFAGHALDFKISDYTLVKIVIV